MIKGHVFNEKWIHTEKPGMAYYFCIGGSKGPFNLVQKLRATQLH
jgi:hypothetical protein